jgi:hypothetical protein
MVHTDETVEDKGRASMDLDSMLRRLGKKWEILVLTHTEYWSCADHTDEGIGGNLDFRGKTPTEAVNKAYDHVFGGQS